MTGLDAILHALRLKPVDDDRYTADNAQTGQGVLFGGQLLAQAIVAGLAGHEGKRVKTIHTVFARAGAPETPVDITVERMHTGRAMASSTVTISQGERLCARSIVLLSADEEDFIRHSEVAPPVSDAESSQPVGHLDGWDIRFVDDVDINDPALVGPPTLDVWSRFPDAPRGDDATDQALLAFASDGFLIATAMRPHAGLGQSLAHVTVSTGVLSHTLTFHERFDAGDWLLLSHRSAHAGHGRCFGQASVFREDGTMVASYVQDGMIRGMEGRNR